MSASNRRPETGETAKRIMEHLSFAKTDGEKRDVSLVWDGYVAALVEWGLVSPNEAGDCFDLTRPHSSDQNKENPLLRIVFCGFSDSTDG